MKSSKFVVVRMAIGRHWGLEGLMYERMLASSPVCMYCTAAIVDVVYFPNIPVYLSARRADKYTFPIYIYTYRYKALSYILVVLFTIF